MSNVDAPFAPLRPPFAPLLPPFLSRQPAKIVAMNRAQPTLDVNALRRIHFEGALRASQSKLREPVIAALRKDQASQPAGAQSQTTKT